MNHHEWPQVHEQDWAEITSTSSCNRFADN